MKDVDALLNEAAELFREKNKEYAGSLEKAGDLYTAFFPNGIELKTKDEFARFNTFSLCVMKLNRYASNFANGGHLDSAKDLSVYAAILQARTDMAKQTKCDFFCCLHDNRGAISVSHCTHMDNPEKNTEGNCHASLCPITREIEWEL